MLKVHNNESFLLKWPDKSDSCFVKVYLCHFKPFSVTSLRIKDLKTKIQQILQVSSILKFSIVIENWLNVLLILFSQQCVKFNTLIK